MEKKYLQSVGSFECVVEHPEAGWIGEQGEKLTPFIRIPLRVVGGENDGEIAVWKGWLSNAAFDNTIKRLAEVFGFDGDLASLHSGKQTLAGNPCNITTESETFEGKARLKIAWLNPPGGGTVKPMDENKVKNLLASLTAKGKAIAKSVNSAAPASKSPTKVAPKSFEEAVDGDDVPS